jgi:hypothetical protein
MDRNQVCELRVDVLSPINVIRVGWIPQSWEERKLQMVVSIDEPRQDQEAAKVDIFGSRNCVRKSMREAEDVGYAIAYDLYRRIRSHPRSHGTPASANCEPTFRGHIEALDHLGGILILRNS